MEDQKCPAASRSSTGRTCSEHPCEHRLYRSFRDLPWVAACCALSLLSLGVCVFVYLKTSELQHRLLNLEKDRDSRPSAWLSGDQVEPMIIDRLDQILEEVSSSPRSPALTYTLLCIEYYKRDPKQYT